MNIHNNSAADRRLKVIHASTGLSTADPFYSDFSIGSAIKTVSDLVKRINELKEDLQNIAGNLWDHVTHNHRYGIYFRGQDDISYDLLPSAGRPPRRYTPDQERNLLHRFRRRSYAHYGRILTDWETIFLARHHFLPCRLLDWSTNPLVALYWACRACCEEPGCEGAVWAFVRQPDEKWDLNVFDAPLFQYEYCGGFAFLVGGVKVIYPFNVSPRITAQGCVFTYQDQPHIPLYSYDPTTYKRESFDLFHVRKWKVQAKTAILKELNDFGINYQTLLPDLQGLGEGIPEIEGLRLGPVDP